MPAERERGPRLTVDGVVLLGGRLVLVRRRQEPFAGYYALPGGFVEYGEPCEAAVAREVQEETGLIARAARLVGVYSDPGRDPRGHTVSVAYVMEVSGGTLKAGDDAAEVATFPLDELPPLAFDHARIVADARRLLERE